MSLSKIPGCAIEAATTNLDIPVPPIVTLAKTTLPSLYKKEHKTYAEALVQAFKAKLVDMETMQQPYCPCQLWTNKAWNGAGISKDSKFTAWCCAYFESINQKLISLQKLGTESKPLNMKGGWSNLPPRIATRSL